VRRHRCQCKECLEIQSAFNFRQKAGGKDNTSPAHLEIRVGRNCSDKYLQSPLRRATEVAYKPEFRLPLNAGADIKHCNSYDETPLHRDGENEHVEVLKEFLSASANFIAADFDGETPLHRAVTSGELAVIRALLEIPELNIDMPDKNVNTSSPRKLEVQISHFQHLNQACSGREIADVLQGGLVLRVYHRPADLLPFPLLISAVFPGYKQNNTRLNFGSLAQFAPPQFKLLTFPSQLR
jgi:ankyrin repeat protein